MKLLVSISILVCLYGCAKKQTYVLRSTIIGKVCDKNHTPIMGAKIAFDKYDLLSPNNIISDSLGVFVIPKVQIKTYYQHLGQYSSSLSDFLILKKNGYKNDTINLEKIENPSDTINLGEIFLEKLK